jgi:DNA-binding beta-propeller fold protein YncE
VDTIAAGRPLLRRAFARVVGSGTLVAAAAWVAAAVVPGGAGAQEMPRYAVDASWPGALPENWILGQVAGIAVDAADHVWLVHRPRSLTDDELSAVRNPSSAECCASAPSVVELDADGRFVQAWGGPRWDARAGGWVEPDYDWPESEHGIFVDTQGNVWLAGNGENDHRVFKFTRDGRHLMTIGRAGETAGSNDPDRLGRPADVYVDAEAGEVYVADGYLNRRVVVFDAASGEYKRHWGAYGEMPNDAELPAYTPGSAPIRQYRGPVHSVVLSADGRVYVADRDADRVQVFERDGTYVDEIVIAPDTFDQGSVWDLAIAPMADERWLFVADGHNRKVWIVDRPALEVVGSFGRGGRQAGQFEWVHNIASDSRGNLYTSEVNTGKRVQKFRRVQ